MNPNVDFLIKNIESFPQYKSSVFDNGFLLTDSSPEITDAYPFYNNWSVTSVQEFKLYSHKRQKTYIKHSGEFSFILIGHALNPYRMSIDENELLTDISKLCKDSLEDALDYIDELTGIFAVLAIKSGNISAMVDYSGFQPFYYSAFNGRTYITSHEEIVAYSEALHRDTFIETLQGYKYYPLYGESLPGDFCCYEEFKKLNPNIMCIKNKDSFEAVRVYPRKPMVKCKNDKDHKKTVKEISEILQKTMELTAKKWPNAAISMTGGRDSKTTLAAAYKVKDKFKYFSYNSQYGEQVDCEAAKKICDSVNTEHITYKIPLEKELYPEYDVVKAIMHVNSNRVKFNHNDIMKRIYFRNNNDFDIEIKSWVSEMGRAFYYKRYNFKKFPAVVKPRYLTAISHIILNRRLLKICDERFSQYIKNTKLMEKIYNFEWTDLFFLEHRYGRWGFDVISCEHIFSYDITVPYNNRKLCESFMSVELQKRIGDITHKDIVNSICPQIENTNIHIQNVTHGKKRELIDKFYYLFTIHRPF